MSAAAGSSTAAGGAPALPSGLLDVLNVASVVLDTKGRIVLWSPQAEELFGYTADEALGQYAAQVMIHERHVDLVVKLFADVMATGQSWAGAFPIRCKDGSTRMVEFRNMRLVNDQGTVYALGLAADQSTVRRLERDVALSTRMVAQSPIGLAVVDPDLRFVSVNPALARMNGLPPEDHVGRRLREVLPSADADALEAAVRAVLRSGEPLIDRPPWVVRRPTRTRITPGRSRCTGWRTRAARSSAWRPRSSTSPTSTGRAWRPRRPGAGWP